VEVYKRKSEVLMEVFAEIVSGSGSRKRKQEVKAGSGSRKRQQEVKQELEAGSGSGKCKRETEAGKGRGKLKEKIKVWVELKTYEGVPKQKLVFRPLLGSFY
jgi:hypothetical protein